MSVLKWSSAMPRNGWSLRTSDLSESGMLGAPSDVAATLVSEVSMFHLINVKTLSVNWLRGLADHPDFMKFLAK